MEWDGSNNGPGWQDVADLLLAINSLHDCTTTIQLSGGTWYGVSRLSAALVAMRPSLESPDGVKSCTVVTFYPTNGHRTVSGWLFGELHNLDKRIGHSWYEQRELFPAPEG